MTRDRDMDADAAPAPSRADPQGVGVLPPARAGNRTMMGKLLVIAVLMFGFGFALVPLYRLICDVTGINFLTKRDEAVEQFARNTQVDTSRKVTIEFDANSQGPWRFRPKANSVDVHPGELVTMVYEIRNTTGRTMVGQAIPSYAPKASEQYFRKLECFCFEQQTLAANESREFPVVFVVDPKVPDRVQSITLSYTFFEIGGKGGPAAAAPTGRPGG